MYFEQTKMQRYTMLTNDDVVSVVAAVQCFAKRHETWLAVWLEGLMASQLKSLATAKSILLQSVFSKCSRNGAIVHIAAVSHMSKEAALVQNTVGAGCTCNWILFDGS